VGFQKVVHSGLNLFQRYFDGPSAARHGCEPAI
jgi:hypothetical protein